MSQFKLKNKLCQVNYYVPDQKWAHTISFQIGFRQQFPCCDWSVPSWLEGGVSYKQSPCQVWEGNNQNYPSNMEDQLDHSVCQSVGGTAVLGVWWKLGHFASEGGH